VQFLVSVFGSAQANRITIIVLTGVYLLAAVARLVQRRRDVAEVFKDGMVRRLDEVPSEPVGR
jgi:hypothetical protein